MDQQQKPNPWIVWTLIIALFVVPSAAAFVVHFETPPITAGLRLIGIKQNLRTPQIYANELAVPPLEPIIFHGEFAILEIEESPRYAPVYLAPSVYTLTCIGDEDCVPHCQDVTTPAKNGACVEDTCMCR